MKRLGLRLNILKALRVSLGAILFSAIWALAGRKDQWNGYVFFFGVLGVFLFLVWMVDECNSAIERANIRVDHEVLRNDRDEARLAAIERRLGWAAQDLDDPDDPDDTPPRGFPILPPGDF